MVPEGYTGNIDVETGSGSLEVQGVTADNISVNSDNGEIEVRDTKAAGSVNKMCIRDRHYALHV